MPTSLSQETAALSLVLPKDALIWFTVADSSVDEETVSITLVEKNNPPKYAGELIFRCYKDITVTDFPIRGKQAYLTFRRRYWSDVRTGKLVANTIPLAFPGTKLETEFANFLKGEGGDSPYGALVHRDVLLPRAERI